MSSLLVSGGLGLAAAQASGGLIDPPPQAAGEGGLFSFLGGGGDDVSSESSSIGSPSEDDDEKNQGDELNDDAESKSTVGGTGASSISSSSLGSLSSLEDSLPFKKGLSNHFAGKSRSFSNLSECAAGNAGDIAKAENPFNKRRRLQIANRISFKRRASCGSLFASALPPLFSPEHALDEAEEDEFETDDGGAGSNDDDRGGELKTAALDSASRGDRFRVDARKIRSARLKPARSMPLFDLHCVN